MWLGWACRQGRTRHNNIIFSSSRMHRFVLPYFLSVLKTGAFEAAVSSAKLDLIYICQQWEVLLSNSSNLSTFFVPRAPCNCLGYSLRKLFVNILLKLCRHLKWMGQNLELYRSKVASKLRRTQNLPEIVLEKTLARRNESDTDTKLMAPRLTSLSCHYSF